MQFNEALKIFGLNANFTEKELKKAHRYLMQMYHPDSNIGKSEAERKLLEEKAKEVNSAYDELKKHLGKVASEDNTIIFSDLIVELGKYFDVFADVDDKLAYYARKVSAVISSFMINAGGKRKNEVYRLFDNAKNEIRVIFDDLCDSYFRQYNIGLEYKNKLDYEVSIQKFYEQLQKIGEEWVLKRINEEVIKYQYYTGYDYLKDWINGPLVKNCKARVKKGGLEEAIKAMHKEAEELFSLYFRINDKFKNVWQLFDDNSYLNQEFLSVMNGKYKEAEVAFKKKNALADVEAKLDEIKEKIERQIRIESQSKMSSPLFKRVMAKYFASMQNYQITNDTTKIYNITKTLEMVIQIFALAKTGKINIDSLMLLDNLTFVDGRVDAVIISSVNSNLSFVNDSNVYLKKNKGSGFTLESCWGVLEESDDSLYMHYFKRVGGISFKRSVTLKELAEEYISLDQFINEMKLMGKIVKFVDLEEKVLYSNGMFNIVLDGNELCITYVEDIYKPFGDFEIPLEYQDREYVKLKIVESIQNCLDIDVVRTRKTNKEYR